METSRNNKAFCSGILVCARSPGNRPGLLEDKRLPLRWLYSYRIASDYDAKEINSQNLDQLLKIVEQIINIVDEKGGK